MCLCERTDTVEILHNKVLKAAKQRFKRRGAYKGEIFLTRDELGTQSLDRKNDFLGDVLQDGQVIHIGHFIQDNNCVVVQAYCALHETNCHTCNAPRKEEGFFPAQSGPLTFILCTQCIVHSFHHHTSPFFGESNDRTRSFVCIDCLSNGAALSKEGKFFRAKCEINCPKDYPKVACFECGLPMNEIKTLQKCSNCST